MSIKKLFYNDFLFSLLNRGISFVINIGSAILLNRYLGPELRGEFGYWQGIAFVASIILGFGIYHSYAYYKRQGEESLIQIYINLFTAQTLLFIILAIILSLISGSIFIGAVVFWTGFIISFNNISFVIAIENPRFRFVSITVYTLLFFILLLLLFLFTRASLIWVFIIGTLSSFVYYIACVVYLKIKPNPFKINIIWMKRAIIYGGFPMLALLLQTLNFRIDLFMLRPFVTSLALGYYVFGASIAELILILPDSFREVLLSRTSRDDSQDAIVLSIKLSNILMLFITAMAIVFGQFVIRILFGNEFVPAYYIMLLLLLGIPGMGWYYILSTLFNVQGHRKFIFITMLSGVLLNVALNLVVIPVWGITGAAVTSIISYYLCGFIFITFYGKQIGRPFYKLLWLNYTDIKAIWSLIKI